MDYLLDNYFFKYLPFDVSESTRSAITSGAVRVIREADWWCKARDPRDLISKHTSFFIAELMFYFLCAATFCHAFRHRGRYLFTWISILVIGLVCENLHFYVREMDGVWHSQSMLTFFGMRTPFHVILGQYHIVYYTAYVLARRLYLSWWAEGPAAGLIAAAINFPVCVMGTKLLWFQLHDSDPSFSHSVYSVPWIFIAFDAVLMCSFVWMLRLCRRLLLPVKYDWMLFMREGFCSLLAAALSVAVGAVHLFALFHPLTDILKIDERIPTLSLLGVYAVIVFCADRHNSNPEARPRYYVKRFWFDELACAVCVHFLLYMLLVFASDPESIVAEGLYQPIGPCNHSEPIWNPSGLALSRKVYLCPSKRSSTMFDFHCLPKGRAPSMIDGEPLEWYTICGTDFPNRFEYIALIWSFSLLALIVLYQVAACSGATPIDEVKVYVRRGTHIPQRKVVMERQDSEDMNSNGFEAAEPNSGGQPYSEVPTIDVKDIASESLVAKADESFWNSRARKEKGAKEVPSSSDVWHSTPRDSSASSSSERVSHVPVPSRNLRARKTKHTEERTK